ncbi:Piso0_005395 [Millerozyma farinosa CBS 7064]|uniref:Piso0_005395 protein n=1 Tax=Pichia sorbitophila (strain ATCC MYA-4447 / BCRC 22081 / CBS 7064 / NBRC 10061 / NRRL Y-12695) TaxID=559304 RepID=G8Y225_PICSO|nr:Piso0_005395 [Millerozyma farinosa CBS 7064]
MSRNDTQDYYQVLGVGYDASEEEIKRFFKKLAVKFHPDKTSDKKHHELFIKAQEAYETLKDPSKKRNYDAKIRPVNRNTYGMNGTFSSGAATTSWRTTTSTFSGGPGYFRMYQQFYKTTDAQNIAQKQREAKEKQERQEKENQAARAAKLAKDRVDERLRREAAEAIFREQKMQKEKLRRDYENATFGNGAHSADSYGTNKKEAHRKEWRNAFSNPMEQQDDLLDQQYHAERRNHGSRNEGSWHNPRYDTPESNESDAESAFQRHGDDPDDPIVLDDGVNANVHAKKTSDGDKNRHRSTTEVKSEGWDSSSENMSSEHASKDTGDASSDEEYVTVINSSSSGEEKEGSAAKNEPGLSSRLKEFEHLFNANMNLRPRTEPTRVSQRRRSVSPTRPNARLSPGVKLNPTTSNVRNAEESTPKRPKNNSSASLGLGELRNHLETDIENVDFSEMLSSLPKEPGDKSSVKNRKISEDHAKLKAKRMKFAEFSDGTSKADTLHTPVNKSSVKGFESSRKSAQPLTVLDLHASPLVHQIVPPTPPQAHINGAITNDTWNKYESSILNYMSEFMNYKKQILQYQFERQKGDEDLFHKIHSDIQSLETYQQCVDRDMKVLQEFTDQLRTYNATMNVYRQNYIWAKIAK